MKKKLFLGFVWLNEVKDRPDTKRFLILPTPTFERVHMNGLTFKYAVANMLMLGWGYWGVGISFGYYYLYNDND